MTVDLVMKLVGLALLLVAVIAWWARRSTPAIPPQQWTPMICDQTVGVDRVIIDRIPGRVPVALAADMRWHLIETDDQGEYLGRVVAGPDTPTGNTRDGAS